MGRLARVAAAVLALVIGGAIGYATRRPRAARPNERPAAVARVVRALDRLGPTTRDDLASALQAAGSPAGFASPWREELELGAWALAGDRVALEAFARASPPAPARARAWLRLALEAPDSARRASALEALEATYPASAAARVYGASPTGPSK